MAGPGRILGATAAVGVVVEGGARHVRSSCDTADWTTHSIRTNGGYVSPTGILHLVFCLLAVAFGAIVLLAPKGTRWHRTWGHGYVWCMTGVIVTSLSMYRLTGGVTPFHFAAIVAALTIGGGMATVLRRRPRNGWIEAHATWMAWSYVGLLAALIAETLTRFVMPVAQSAFDASVLWPAFWGLVLVGTVGTVVVGSWMIRRRLPDAIRGTPAAMRAERVDFEAADR